MSETRRTGLSIIANWAALLSGFLIMYFLSPFVVNRLGTTAYGTWVILGSLTSYMALLDLGMRGAVTRFVARHHASGDHVAASGSVSAALWFRQWIAVLVIVATAVLLFFLDTITSIPPETLSEARAAFAVSVATVVVMLIGGVFGGVLAAMNRYSALSASAIMHGVVRAFGTILVLGAGYSLIALALVEFAAALLAETVIVVQSLRHYPELRISIRVPDRATRNELTMYSGSMMLVQVFARIAQYSQTLIVGAFISVSAVAFFAIGQMLVESVRQVLLTIGPVFMPLASRLDATGRTDSIQRLVATGTRLILVLILPILVTLYVRGETFIGLWMGSLYAERSGEVLRILAISMLFQAGTSAAHNVLFGMGAIRPAMVCNGLEAAGTVVLSLVLAPAFGLTGIAWASSVPVIIVRTTIWQAYVCRLVDVRLVKHLREGWLRPLLAASPLVLVSIFIEQNWRASSVSFFFIQVAAAMIVYALSCAVFLWPDVRRAWTLAWPSASNKVDHEVTATATTAQI